MNLRLVSVFFFGFSSGLPFSLVGTTLVAWYASLHIDVITIGLLALVGQPYVYKVLWAPLIDRYTFFGLGRRRDWLLLTQSGLILSLSVMAFMKPQTHPLGVALWALWIALLSASQDIVIDAYRADILTPKERGLGSALTVAGYRLATLISGALALFLAQIWGWKATYLLMGGLMILGLITTLFIAPTPPLAAHSKSNLKEALIEPFASFINKQQAWYLLAFIFLYKFAESFTSTSGGITMAFLIDGLNFDLATVGLINKGLGIVATLLGSFIAGVLLYRIPLFLALFYFGLLQAATNLLFFALSVVGKNIYLLSIAVFADNLSAGLALTALIALMMGWCEARFSATQFALLSAISALPRVIAGPIAGATVAWLGWPIFYALTFFFALPALLVLMKLRSPIAYQEQQQKQASASEQALPAEV